MDRIVCFGDSNTYGYDPRGYLGGRYFPEVRWTGRLKAVGLDVLNLGQNGMQIPAHRKAGALAARVGDLSTLHTIIVMLGTNDLLCDPARTAEAVAAQMERFLSALCASIPREKLLLIAPVPMVPGEWVTEERTMLESARLGECYAAAAEKLGVRFADAAEWGVSLCYDGVHFTEAGHTAFANGVLKALNRDVKAAPRQR